MYEPYEKPKEYAWWVPRVWYDHDRYDFYAKIFSKIPITLGISYFVISCVILPIILLLHIHL